MTTSTRRAALRCPEFAILSALAFLTRFWKLFDPLVVIWDEKHFIRYTSAYFTGSYYIDVHPPLGKLLFYATAKLLGVSGTALATNQPAPLLRLLPAIAGALIIPVVFLLMRELGASRRVATFAAACLLLDNALLSISRIIVMDSMLTLFGLTAICLFAAARHESGRKRWLILTASAIAAGLAAGTKWTGLTALGLMGLIWAFDIVRERRRGRALVYEALLFVVVPMVVYIIPFAIHFSLLTREGPNDFSMSIPFQATLFGNGAYTPGATYPFWRAFAELHRVMMIINIGWASDFNIGASPWYTWPVAKHGIGLWASMENLERIRWMAIVGNGAIWFPLLYGMIGVAIAALMRHAAIARHRAVLILLAAGYVMNFLPFAFIERPMYLYHYFFAFTFSAMFVALGVGALAGWDGDDEHRFWSFGTRRATMLYGGFICVAGATFLYLFPLATGAAIDEDAFRRRRVVAERRPAALRDVIADQK